MTQQTLDLIHRTYQKALEISTNHLEVSEKLYQLLYSENVVEEDCKLFDTFLDALRACIFLKNFQTEEYHWRPRRRRYEFPAKAAAFP